MIIKSTNIAEPAVIEWNGKQHTTGIYKKPVDDGILLESEDVKGDHVIDRRYHGGTDKACYLYSADHYSFWKKKYPEPDWLWGMFGENLTVSGLDESMVRIGNEYKIGEAFVQVSQPRQPCFKLGVRFGTQNIVKDFWESAFPGVYVRVIQSGLVKAGDEMIILKNDPNALSVAEVFSAFTTNRKNKDFIEKAIAQEYLANSCKHDLEKLLVLI